MRFGGGVFPSGEVPEGLSPGALNPLADDYQES
jgi:hypothetical protein